MGRVKLAYAVGIRPGAIPCRRLQVLHRVSSGLLGPVNSSFRALPGRLKFTVRRHRFNQDCLSLVDPETWGATRLVKLKSSSSSSLLLSSLELSDTKVYEP